MFFKFDKYRKFYSRQEVEDVLKFYPSYMIYDGNNDEQGREYWTVGTQINSITDKIKYVGE